MIAGTLGLLSEPAAEPLETHYESGQRAVVVDRTQQYLGDADALQSIQAGIVAGQVDKEIEAVTVTDTDVAIETRERVQTVASDWLGDVDGQGWVLAERTHSTDEWLPPWPFSTVQQLADGHVEIDPIELDPAAFLKRQQEAGREIDLEMTTRSEGTDDVSITWGRRARTQSNPDVGVAGTVKWDGTYVRLCLYESGYVAIWEPEAMSIEAAGRFVAEELLPIAERETDDGTSQTTLGDSGGSESKSESDGDEGVEPDGGPEVGQPDLVAAIDGAVDLVIEDVLASQTPSPAVAADFVAEQQGLTHRLDELLERTYARLREMDELQGVARERHDRVVDDGGAADE